MTYPKVLNDLYGAKTVLGDPNPSTGGTDSVMNYLKKVDDAVSGGSTDIMDFTPFVSVVAANNSTYQSLLNITGEGVLCGINVMPPSFAGTYYEFSIKLTIDGVVKFEALLGQAHSSGYPQGGSVLGPLPFNNGLKIEGKVNAAGNPFNTTISYGLL